MEGYLLVPPERSAIIGKTGWKTRYVTVGTIKERFEGGIPARPDLPRSSSASKLIHARKDLRAASALASTTDLSIKNPAKLWLGVFKQKGDIEPISHNALSTIKRCGIQSIQYRKGDAPVPTLVITFEVDVAAEKVRKRRSSRAGILQAQSSAYPNSLLFRTVPEQRYNIYDWQVTIQPRIQPNMPDFAEDAEPAFTAFRNPFAKAGERPQISKPILRPEPLHGHSHTKDFGSRQTTSSLISPSPSLRSQRSDISSQSSFRPRPYAGSHLPLQTPSTDLPSPVSTLGYEDQFISGWTNAQGRSSALSTNASNHTRTCSVSTTSTPPIVRETILDRAFNLNLIPGADRVPSSDSGEGAMSSIARFEALMLEHERRKKAVGGSRPETGERDQWSLVEEGDSESESSHSPSAAERDGGRGVREGVRVRENFFDDASRDGEEEDLDEIPLRAQRALEYIMSGRTSSTAPKSAVISTRPKSERTKSYTLYSPMPPSMMSVPLPPMPMQMQRGRQRPMSFSYGHSGKTSRDTEAEFAKQQSLLPNINTNANMNQQQQSNTSAKRLSFSDFSKRISRDSNNSSLLLVQTNSRNSAASSGGSTYHDEEDKENEDMGEEVVGRGLTASRLSVSGMSMARPGMGGRRSTVAGEARGYGLGLGMRGFEEVKRHGQERVVPLGRRRAEREKEEVQMWRGSGLFTGGEGGFL